MGIKDSLELAWQDWLGIGRLRPARRPPGEDYWARRWAEAYVDFAAGEKRAWLHELGLHSFPMVGWAERGGAAPPGPRQLGAPLPRHLGHRARGRRALRASRCAARRARGLVSSRFRHRVDELVVEDGAVVGVRGVGARAERRAERGAPSSRAVVGDFELRAPAVIVTSGGIGGNHDLVRADLAASGSAPPPEHLISGVPAHVDGRMLEISEAAGGRLVNRDRMWHYTEGIHNWDPIWPAHGIRILPGPSSMWFDALGRRLPAPNFPGCDTLGTLRRDPRAPATTTRGSS